MSKCMISTFAFNMIIILNVTIIKSTLNLTMKLIKWNIIKYLKLMFVQRIYTIKSVNNISRGWINKIEGYLFIRIFIN